MAAQERASHAAVDTVIDADVGGAFSGRQPESLLRADLEILLKSGEPTPKC